VDRAARAVILDHDWHLSGKPQHFKSMFTHCGPAIQAARE
jgi:hypothetical protein